MNKIFMRVISRALCLLMVVLTVTGCGTGKKENGGGQVSITIGNWPTEAQEKSLEAMNKIKDEFEAANPDIKIIPDTSDYSAEGFMLAAAAGTLPNCFQLAFTETENAMNSGYLADLTEYMSKRGYTSALNPTLVDFITKDGKYYGIPSSVYSIGLMCNKELFEKAGLKNIDGTIKIPQTFEEMAETAALIKKKTGKAGLAIPTTNKIGGWIFMETAWSNGVKFMEKDYDGKWKATFNSPEMIDALQYISDLKWKYNAIQDNGLADQQEVRKLYGTEQAAMYFAAPPENFMVSTYSFDKDKMAVGRVPEGKAGRISQLGGSVFAVSGNSTPEQIEAVMKWIEFRGMAPNTTDEQLNSLETSIKASADANQVVLEKNVFDIYISEEYIKKREEIRKKYSNVDIKDFSEYLDGEDVVLKPEEPVMAQQLYEILDAGIQKVLSDKNADIAATVSEMAEKFQNNYLDEIGN